MFRNAQPNTAAAYPDLDIGKDDRKSLLGNDSTPPEPLFEPDNDVVPNDDLPADGSVEIKHSADR